MRYQEIVIEARPPKPIQDIEVPVPTGVFSRLGIPVGKVFADCKFLARKHDEYFDTPEHVRLHVEEVLQRPDYIFPANQPDHRLLVRTNGDHRAVALEIIYRGGKYRVRSAYVLTDVQLQTMLNKQQGG
jgi:hypothetical protein